MIRKILGLCSVLIFVGWGGAVNAGLIEVVADGGFEGGSPNASWAETSTNFGTPLCTIASCIPGGSTGPYSGSWWAWFGGTAGVNETGSVSQDVTIPVGTSATLSFYYRVPVADAASGFLEVSLGGSSLFLDDTNTTIGAYSIQSIDVSSFADGGTYALLFNSITTAGNGPTNYFVDAVSLQVETESVPAPATLALLGLGLAGLGWSRRKQA